MDHKKCFVLISTASLLHFRGVEHWLIEVATRLKGSIILTFSTGLKSIDNVKARVALAKSRLGNVEWHELRVISHEHAGKGVPSFITRFMRHSGIVIPINLKIIKLLRGKFTYLVIGDAYQAMLLTAIAAISGTRKVILGLHSRPSYKHFILIKPLLTLSLGMASF